MPITVKQVSDQIAFGDADNSFSVPMGNFALVKNDHSTVRFLKSTGFASCIGLILYSTDWTLLAHFQSANWSLPSSGNLVPLDKLLSSNKPLSLEKPSSLEKPPSLEKLPSPTEIEKPKPESGIELTITAFGHAGINDYSLYEGFGFLGSNVNAIAQSSMDELSKKNTKSGLRRLKTALQKKGVSFLQKEPEDGFQSVAVSLATGEVRLFDITPKASITANTNAYPQPGTALTRVQPG
jgi:hypothetical protein